MRYLRRNERNRGSVQIAGYGRAAWLSASRALVRRGLVRPGTQTGYYALTDEGRTMADAMLAASEGPK